MVSRKYTPLIVTPWAYPSELPQIRSVIFRLGPNAPPSEDRRQEAVNLLEAWKMRGGLPHAMDATCLLLNAILNAGKPNVTHLSARSVYAVAWARFVTGFCDLGKDARYRGSSMYKVAKDIGMPLHFVDLRHEISHEGLPSLQHLTKAAEDGIAWLWTHFWADMDMESSAPIGKFPVPSHNMPDELDTALAELRRARKEELKGGKATGSESLLQVASMKALVDLTALLHGDHSGLATVATSLVKIGYLVPKNRQLGDDMDLVYTFWDALLLEVSGGFDRFAPLLLKQLTITTLQPASRHANLDPFREALQAWILHILHSPTWLSIRVHHHEAMCRETLRICHGSTNLVAAELAQQVISTSAGKLSEDTQPRTMTDQAPVVSSGTPVKKRKY